MEGSDANDIEIPPLRQFAAKDGLKTVRTLLLHNISHADGVKPDLHDCERILTVADRDGVGWHFEIDI